MISWKTGKFGQTYFHVHDVAYGDYTANSQLLISVDAFPVTASLTVVLAIKQIRRLS